MTVVKCDSRQSDVHITETDGSFPLFLPQAYQFAQAGNCAAATALLTPTNLALGKTLEPGSPHIVSWHTLLGSTWRRLGNLEAACTCYEQLKVVQPSTAVYFELIAVYRLLNRWSDAVRCCEEAMTLDDCRPEIKGQYADCLMNVGRCSEARSVYRELIDTGQADADTHAAYLWSLYYQPCVGRLELRRAYEQWAQRFAGTERRPALPNCRDDNDRPLRVAYLCADFRTHSVTYTFEPLLDGHDRDGFTWLGYGHVAYPDETTQRLRKKFSIYRDVWGQSPEVIAQTIRNDEVDILVTIGGHCSATCMQVLAQRPAPVQADIGSLSSIGLTQVDYRVADAVQDPPEAAPAYTETLVTLPGAFIAYRAPETCPSVGALPASRNGYVTFSAFGHHLKVNDNVVATWAMILKQVPQSRLLIKCFAGGDPMVGRWLRTRFEKQGISAGRLDIRAWVPKAQHWALFNEVDIALDTFPFNGGLTTLEGLWMGVPTVTVRGDTFASRTGAAILERVGMSPLIATNPDGMIKTAVGLANNLEVLARLRGGLRNAVAASPLYEHGRMARELEAAYQEMWKRRCDSMTV